MISHRTIGLCSSSASSRILLWLFALLASDTTAFVAPGLQLRRTHFVKQGQRIANWPPVTSQTNAALETRAASGSSTLKPKNAASSTSMDCSSCSSSSNRRLYLLPPLLNYPSRAGELNGFSKPKTRDAEDETLVLAESVKETLSTAEGAFLETEVSLPELLEDTLDTEGQTIAHWDGSTRWALVEPDLAALKQEKSKLERKCKWLLRRLANVNEIPRLKVSKERERARQQLNALRMRAEMLRQTIDQYSPEEHHSECIAEGGHGMIMMGKDLATGERVAIKVERVWEGWESYMHREAEILSELQEDAHFPNVLHFGRQTLNINPSSQSLDCLVLVMNLLGGSIHDLWWETTRGRRGLDTATAIALTLQMLERLEKLHAEGFIHRDVKLNNFVMSGDPDFGITGDDSGKGGGHVCLIDFGVAIPFEEERQRAARNRIGGRSSEPQLFGTFEFMSANAHAGGAQSFSDDLESLVYCFAFMVHGGLPWGNEGNEEILAIKRLAVDSILADGGGNGGPEQAHTVYNLVDCEASRALIQKLLGFTCDLRFGERPDYAAWKAALMDTYSEVTGQADAKHGVDHTLEWQRTGMRRTQSGGNRVWAPRGGDSISSAPSTKSLYRPLQLPSLQR
mmetsp:Transcript_122266/g.182692  ORF Transcript_122266/g.182692 Transcript_122266/m.182692 type:complete len:626 (-) Transcript_122266:402-2279(-)